LGLKSLEIEYNNDPANKALGNPKQETLIKVRAVITCPNGDYRKKFKNQFPRSQLELMSVALRIFDWLTCEKCGELLKLDLEFEI
jgi:hypothetical protein